MAYVWMVSIFEKKWLCAKSSHQQWLSIWCSITCLNLTDPAYTLWSFPLLDSSFHTSLFLKHDHLSSVTWPAGVVLDKPMSSAWQSVPHHSRSEKRICLRVSNWFVLILISDFLWKSFCIYACLSCRFVKLKSCEFSIFCCWICGRKKYWIPDKFTICISVNLIGSSPKTNADHLSPFCSSNSQYSMFPFQMFSPDGPTPLPLTDVCIHIFSPISKPSFFWDYSLRNACSSLWRR